jgi:hypothetical protein
MVCLPFKAATMMVSAVRCCLQKLCKHVIIMLLLVVLGVFGVTFLCVLTAVEKLMLSNGLALPTLVLCFTACMVVASQLIFPNNCVIVAELGIIILYCCVNIAVLDLDPMRLIGMLRTWFEQHTQKHHNM